MTGERTRQDKRQDMTRTERGQEKRPKTRQDKTRLDRGPDRAGQRTRQDKAQPDLIKMKNPKKCIPKTRVSHHDDQKLNIADLGKLAW